MAFIVLGLPMNMDTKVEALRDLAGRHDVWYEVWPEYSVSDGKQVQAGFALELCGLRDQVEQRLTPGDEASKITYSDLRQIASAVLQTSADGSEYSIQPFDRALHECSRRRSRLEVVLSIDIFNRHPESDLHAGENNCLHVIEKKLTDLGIRGGHGSSMSRVSCL
jgi:hypothetical protein